MPTEKGNQQLAQDLMKDIYTTATLKGVSDTLEGIVQNDAFKKHANSIIADSTLTDAQKQTQLNYLIRHIDDPMIYDFFTRQITNNQLWLFRTDKIDYLDNFVRGSK